MTALTSTIPPDGSTGKTCAYCHESEQHEGALLVAYLTGRDHASRIS